MECYKHQGKGAVVQCHSCSKGMCSTCSEQFTVMQCEKCLLESNERVQQRIIGSFVIAFIFAALGVYGGMTSASGMGEKLGYAYLGFSLPWAYHFFGSFLSNPFRAILTLLAGWIIAPFSIVKTIKEWKVVQETRRVIHQNEG
ncbi:hypothetical protein NYE33_33530 [Paenibacillus sp. FSL R10-2199]|uniref:hypothetical protein n=1 Tax=Paenibacillus sp. FSL R10-2199 TaxID=2975348 RepID=UPI0030F781D1